MLCVGLFDADQEAALEVEEGVEIEEDVVHLVTTNDTPFFYQLLELLQQLQMLYVGTLRLDQLVDDVLALGALGADAASVVEGFGDASNLALGDELVEHFVDDVGDLCGSVSAGLPHSLLDAHFHKSGCVVTVQVAEDEAAVLGDAQLGDAALDELVAGHLLVLLQALLVLLGAGDSQEGAGLEGVVQLHQRVAPPEGAPQQRDGVGVVVGLALLLGDPAVEARDEAQAHLQRQAALEQRGVLVGPLVEDIVRGFDGSAIDGCRRCREAGRGVEQRRAARGLGALRVARAAVRVARVGALEALVRHEGRRPGRGHPGVCSLL